MLSAYHPELPTLRVPNLTKEEVLKQRKALRKQGYTHFFSSEPEVKDMAKYKRVHVMRLLAQGGKIEGDLIKFPDCVHVGYGEWIKQIQNIHIFTP